MIQKKYLIFLHKVFKRNITFKSYNIFRFKRNLKISKTNPLEPVRQ